MVVIAVANLKGGSGKTTVAALLAAIAARSGHRVLAVDVDPQASLTTVFMQAFTHSVENTAIALATNMLSYNASVDVKSAVHTVKYSWLTLDLLPSHPRIYEMYFRASVAYVSDRALRLLLSRVEGYDVIIVDAPPDPIFTNYAVRAADYIVVPTDPTHIGGYTAALFIEMLARGCREGWFDNRPRLLAVIGNKFDFRDGKPSENDEKRIRRVLSVLKSVETAGCYAGGDDPIVYLPRSEQYLGSLVVYGRRVSKLPIVTAVEWLEAWSKRGYDAYTRLKAIVERAVIAGAYANVSKLFE